MDKPTYAVPNSISKYAISKENKEYLSSRMKALNVLEDSKNSVHFGLLVELLRENCSLNVAELSDDEKTELKMQFTFNENLVASADLEGATNRIEQIRTQDAEEYRSIYLREYSKIFNNTKPGYRCKITLPQVTSNSIAEGINVKKVELDYAVRISSLAAYFVFIIKRVMGIEGTIEFIYDDFTLIPDVGAIIDIENRKAIFQTEQGKVFMYCWGSELNKEGYTLDFSVAVE